jgi:hypothetical protein
MCIKCLCYLKISLSRIKVQHYADSAEQNKNLFPLGFSWLLIYR